MDLLKLIFLVIILALTRLGDFVLFLWQGVKSIFSKMFKFKKKKKKERGKKKKEITIIYPRSVFFSKIKFFILGMFFSSIFIFIPILTWIFISDLPNPYNLSLNAIPKTTKIYDRNDNLLYEIYANQDRTVVKLDSIPQYLKEATISIEDKDFYNHPGFDVRGIARAILVDIRNRDLQGGSTITQQLIKSAFLSPEPTFARKLKEIILAFLAERVYEKDRILEFYFNYVPYGGTAWGVQSASEIYFGKNVEDLDLAESAFLAGMPKAPSIYSPFIDGNKLWKGRQKEVLYAMVKQNYISESDAKKAYEEELKFQKPESPIKAPHFVMYVKNLLVRKYGLDQVERGGLKVKTTLDLNLQHMAENIVKNEVENDAYLNIRNGASLITDPKTGDILAMVGNHNYFDTENGGNVNVTNSLRQPGSSIKIVTYTLALVKGMTEATLLDDSPLTISLPEGAYTPVNYDGRFHGKLPLRYAFGNSLNIPAVRLAQQLGVENIVNFGKKLGVSTWDNPKRYGYSITLGAGEVTMLDLATVFGTVANSGERVDLDPFIEVTDSEGKIIYSKNPLGENVIDSGISFIISDILSDNNARTIEFGPNSPLKIDNHRVSVKTGTSDNKRDNWTVGFTKDYVVATWVGNNDNTPMSQELASGITGAAPMWNKIITSLLKDKQDPPLIIPSNVIQKKCYGINAYFIKGTESSVKCNSFPTPTPTP